MTTQDADAAALAGVCRQYFSRYDIDRIDLAMQPGVVESAESVCHLDITFTPGYRVQFKLQGELARLGERVASFLPEGKVVLHDGATGPETEAAYAAFFNSIEGRLARIQHEERVQGITFLGNTFVLNGKTVFDVVGDDDGRLTIEMHKGDQRQSAMLLASSLLDGLYDGSIVPRD